jgi:hypothetical protein
MVRIEEWETLHFRIDLAAEFGFMSRAVGSNLHAIVWTANCDEIANWVRCVASFNNESANKCALRDSDHVELRFTKNWVLQDLFASLFGLLDHGCEDGCLDAITNLNALSYATSTFPNFINIFDDFLVITALLESVEYHSWHGFIGLRAGTTLRHEIFVGMSLGLTMLQVLWLRFLRSGISHFS